MRDALALSLPCAARRRREIRRSSTWRNLRGHTLQAAMATPPGLSKQPFRAGNFNALLPRSPPKACRTNANSDLQEEILAFPCLDTRARGKAPIFFAKDSASADGLIWRRGFPEASGPAQLHFLTVVAADHSCSIHTATNSRPTARVSSPRTRAAMTCVIKSPTESVAGGQKGVDAWWQIQRCAGVGGGVEDEPHLVGVSRAAGGPITFELGLVELDQILCLAACAIEDVVRCFALPTASEVTTKRISRPRVVGLDARDDAAFGLTPIFRRISGLGISP